MSEQLNLKSCLANQCQKKEGFLMAHQSLPLAIFIKYNWIRTYCTFIKFAISKTQRSDHYRRIPSVLCNYHPLQEVELNFSTLPNVSSIYWFASKEWHMEKRGKSNSTVEKSYKRDSMYLWNVLRRALHLCDIQRKNP